MKINFEDWILNQDFKQDVKELFIESFICYRSNAYRASFILSYLGFMTIIKFRILNGKCPTAIQQGMWNQLQSSLRDEDAWEKKTFDSTQNSTNQLFKVTEDLRNQIKYWKNRRNDCVHFKNNIVDYALVETFWSFLQTSLPKIVINGSKNALVEKIENHFDPASTQPGLCFKHLVEEISDTVSNSDLLTFFSEISQVFNDENDEIEFLNSVYQLCTISVQNKLTEYLLKRDNNLLLLYILRKHPELIHILNSKDSRIRKLWYKVLFNHRINDFAIYCALLRNQMIPQDQIEDFIKKSFERNRIHSPSDQELDELNKHNYLSLLGDFIFGSYRDTNWFNEYDDIVKFYLEKSTITPDEAKSLNKIFDRNKWPWALENRLNELFEEFPDKKEHIKLLLENDSIKIGEHFQFLD